MVTAMSCFKGAISCRLVPCPWGSEHSSSWPYPSTAPRKLTQIRCLPQPSLPWRDWAKLPIHFYSVFSVSSFSFEPRSYLVFRCFDGCGQEKVVGREGRWVRMWLGPSSGGYGGWLELTWLGRTRLCPQPASYLVKQEVKCRGHFYTNQEMEKVLWKGNGRGNTLKARQAFTTKRISAKKQQRF